MVSDFAAHVADPEFRGILDGLLGLNCGLSTLRFPMPASAKV